MWTSFFPDVVVGILVAALTALFGWFAYRHERKRNERAALRRLIGDLARRRAFVIDEAAIRPVPVQPGDHDFDSVGKSVISVRGAVDEARVATREKSDVHRALDQMTVACNIYLELSSMNSENYIIELDRLRSSLMNQISGLRAVHSMLPNQRPGSKAFESE